MTTLVIPPNLPTAEDDLLKHIKQFEVTLLLLGPNSEKASINTTNGNPPLEICEFIANSDDTVGVVYAKRAHDVKGVLDSMDSSVPVDLDSPDPHLLLGIKEKDGNILIARRARWKTASSQLQVTILTEVTRSA